MEFGDECSSENILGVTDSIPHYNRSPDDAYSMRVTPGEAPGSGDKTEEASDEEDLNSNDDEDSHLSNLDIIDDENGDDETYFKFIRSVFVEDDASIGSNSLCTDDDEEDFVPDDSASSNDDDDDDDDDDDENEDGENNLVKVPKKEVKYTAYCIKLRYLMNNIIL